MAAALMVALPCLILFFLAQRYFVQGHRDDGDQGLAPHPTAHRRHGHRPTAHRRSTAHPRSPHS